MVQVDKLVYGSGATRDAGFVSITPPAFLMIDMLLIRGVLGIGLPKLSAVQGALLQRAKKYAMEVCDNSETTLIN